MPIQLNEKNLNKIIVIGDRVLIQPTAPNNKTKSGLFLPPGIQEKEEIATGYIIKVGPGYPLPNINEEETWKKREEPVKYLPLQVEPGDLAVYLQKNAIEVMFNNIKYLILPQNAILMVIREEE